MIEINPFKRLRKTSLKKPLSKNQEKTLPQLHPHTTSFYYSITSITKINILSLKGRLQSNKGEWVWLYIYFLLVTTKRLDI